MNIFIISAGLTLVILGLIMTFQRSPTDSDEVDATEEPSILEEVVETAAPEPSLADRIQELWNTWEKQKQDTQEYHRENYKKYAAVIIDLMNRLGVEETEIKTEFPENTVLLMTESANGETKTKIRIERREGN